MSRMLDQFSMPPMERASRPIPSKTSPTPFMTPCAVPQDARNPTKSNDVTNFFMISAPHIKPDLADCVAHAKSVGGRGRINDAARVCGGGRPADNGVLWVGDVLGRRKKNLC